MDPPNVAAIYAIVQMMQKNDKLFEVKVPTKADESSFNALLDLLESEPFRFYVTDKEESFFILRVELCGILEFGRKTEKLLENIVCKSPSKERRIKRANKSNSCTERRTVANKAAFDMCNLKNRAKLPIAACRTDINNWLASDAPVAILCGPLDNSRIVQMVQYVLEYCQTHSERCRTVCVVSDELRVLLTADTIAQERAETVGKTIGYDIGISNRLSHVSNVAVCSIRTLLANLMAPTGNALFAVLTHLIVDDVGQRSVGMDLLLSLLKEKHHFHPTLKLLLLSSRARVTKVAGYFGASVFSVPESTWSLQNSPPPAAKHVYLATILAEISTNKVLKKLKQTPQGWDWYKVADHHAPHRYQYLDDSATDYLDGLLEDYWFESRATPNELDVLCENPFLVDYQHSRTRMSALMIAASKESLPDVRVLLNLGANLFVRGKHDLRAKDWCADEANSPCWKLMDLCYEQHCNQPSKFRLESSLLWLYQRIHNPYSIDHQMVVDIVEYIYTTLHHGKVLVVLPEFTDVLGCYKLLRASSSAPPQEQAFVFCHSQLTEDEIVLEFARIGDCIFQVILLEDRLFEVLPTMDTVDYVIDTGLSTFRDYNVSKNSHSIASTFIPLETASLRSGLAKRICFHLYTCEQQNRMVTKKATNRRIAARPEETLQALLCRPRSAPPVVQFFSNALIDAPDANVKRSLELLVKIGAITAVDLAPTNLGLLLANLCSSVQLGKTILYGIMFRCLDPVMTIVASLCVGFSPFLEPADKVQLKAIAGIKKGLDHGTQSDCFVLLRLFLLWNTAKLDDEAMVRQYRLKCGAMQAINNTRVMLMSHLRAIDIVKVGAGTNVNVLNENSGNWSTVKACLAAGLYPNVARVDYAKKCLVCCSEAGDNLEPHPLSVINVEEMASAWAVYVYKLDPTPCWQAGESTCQNRTPAMTQMVENTVISNWTMALMCGNPPTGSGKVIKPSQSDELIIDRKYVFQIPDKALDKVRSLRRSLAHLFHKFTASPSAVLEDHGANQTIAQISEILHNEEVRQISFNTGTRPKIVKKCMLGVYSMTNSATIASLGTFATNAP
ncbi:putative ATP-dependent RNA helicase DHX57 [Anopheles bellator]|uniref:putative ATP-dependent RNA helicase DHX57 n=1 Tax=Anopheles bellator TaxID=139047 RepID=UPI00264726B3|nr:putative ATP-dependent RNA helicase DHX57 [Anopheles bellator]